MEAEFSQKGVRMLKTLKFLPMVAFVFAFGVPAPTSAATPAVPPPGSEAESSNGCCPTYDPNADCWSEGHWHDNHCKSACTVDL